MNYSIVRLFGLFVILVGISLMSPSRAEAKFMNISVNPLTLLFSGTYGAQVDFGIGSKFTLGPNFSYTSLTSGVDTGKITSYGARADFYLGNPRFVTSWVLGLSGSYMMMNSATLGEMTSTGGVMTFGRHWFWTRFNSCLGGGLQYIAVSGSGALATLFSGFSGVLPYFEWTFGVSF